MSMCPYSVSSFLSADSSQEGPVIFHSLVQGTFHTMAEKEKERKCRAACRNNG